MITQGPGQATGWQIFFQNTASVCFTKDLVCEVFIFKKLKTTVIPWLDHGTQVMYPYIMGFEQKYYYVYIMASAKNGTLYIGFTSNLPQRIFEHKNHLLPGFTNKYNVDKLVYFERFEDVTQAIRHEKRLKEWKRNWKKDLIEKYNPQWRDLYDDLNNLL